MHIGRIVSIFSVYNYIPYIIQKECSKILGGLYMKSNIIYLKTEKVFIGIAMNIVINFLILIVGIAYQYHITNNTLGETQIMNILNIYTISVNTIGMIYLFINTDKKECLS